MCGGTTSSPTHTVITFKGDTVGAKKTGRKKKSEYRKYKDHLSKLKKMETALATMRTVTSTAMEIAKLIAVSTAPKRFASGGIVSPSESNDMICNSGEMVVPLRREEQDKIESERRIDIKSKMTESEKRSFEEQFARDYDQCLFNCDH